MKKWANKKGGRGIESTEKKILEKIPKSISSTAGGTGLPFNVFKG